MSCTHSASLLPLLLCSDICDSSRVSSLWNLSCARAPPMALAESTLSSWWRHQSICCSVLMACCKVRGERRGEGERERERRNGGFKGPEKWGIEEDLSSLLLSWINTCSQNYMYLVDTLISPTLYLHKFPYTCTCILSCTMQKYWYKANWNCHMQVTQ